MSPVSIDVKLLDPIKKIKESSQKIQAGSPAFTLVPFK
jgi:hypothetical protein